MPLMKALKNPETTVLLIDESDRADDAFDTLGDLHVDQSREFILRSEVVSPIEVIRSATTIAAQVLRQEGKLGTLAPGAFADIIVIDGNPLKNLALFEGQGQHLSAHHEGREAPQEPPELRFAGGGPQFMVQSTSSADAAGHLGERVKSFGFNSRRIGRVALNGAAGVTLAYILTPLVFVTWLAFFRQEIPSFPPEGYSLRWFWAIAGNDRFVSGFLLSLQLAVIATSIGFASACRPRCASRGCASGAARP